jgi:nicotinamidase-related amidase
MRPTGPSLILPHGTPVIVVDPLRDFMDQSGTFAKCYGAQDTESIRDVLPVLTEMLRTWRGKTWNILCQSLYARNQWKVRGLEELCTKENCSGRESLIGRASFDFTATKSDNSVTSMAQGEVEELGRHMRKHLILTGVTTTSCIAKSVEALRIGFVRIIIPRNAVAARNSQQKKADALFEGWSDERMTKVIVVPTWREITFESPPGAASPYSSDEDTPGQ